MKSMFTFFPVAALALLAANTMYGAPTLTPCPIVTGGTAGGGGGPSGTYTANTALGTTNGCNVLITFNADGSITTTNPNPATSYDAGNDDNLVGIINNSGTAISNLSFVSSTNSFQFDGDGACDTTGGGWIFAAGNPCGGVTSASGTAASGVTYGHDTGATAVTFSNISNAFHNGTVDFATAIGAGGGMNWFSLEGPVALTLTVTANTPEPSSLLLFGTLLAVIAFKIRHTQARRAQ